MAARASPSSVHAVQAVIGTGTTDSRRGDVRSVRALGIAYGVEVERQVNCVFAISAGCSCAETLSTGVKVAINAIRFFVIRSDWALIITPIVNEFRRCSINIAGITSSVIRASQALLRAN